MCNSMNMLDVICPFAKNVTHFHQQLLVSINKFCFSSLKARVMKKVVIKNKFWTTSDHFLMMKKTFFSDGQIKNWWKPTKWWKPFFSYEKIVDGNHFGQLWTTLDNFGQFLILQKTIFGWKPILIDENNCGPLWTTLFWWKPLWTTLGNFGPFFDEDQKLRIMFCAEPVV